MPIKPVWNKGRRELCFGGVVVKRFRQPAKNQLSVLESFQELRWPAHIDNPLTGGDSVDARDRLHDTIRRLNNHIGRVIHFMSDGLGQGITWELRNPQAAKKRPGAPHLRPRSAPGAPLDIAVVYPDPLTIENDKCYTRKTVLSPFPRICR